MQIGVVIGEMMLQTHTRQKKTTKGKFNLIFFFEKEFFF